MKNQLISAFFCSMFAMTACNNASKTSAPNASITKAVGDTTLPKETPTMVGGDRDEHNCIGSAGYQWSELRKECLRLFEKGVRLNPVDKALNQTSSALIILSEDQSKA